MMPAMRFINDEAKHAIATFVLDLKEDFDKEYSSALTPEDSLHHVPYKMNGYRKFLSADNYPAISPPWGTLTAIDLNSGELIWKTVLGEYPELKAAGIPPTGTENYGGPVVTAGGLVFIGATLDNKFRAFHKRTGKVLWEYELPASAFATPAIYELNGRQYVVIACGGGKLKTMSGDTYVSFALPEN
jgi:quinoprotein glucose dehydrogenase